MFSKIVVKYKIDYHINVRDNQCEYPQNISTSYNQNFQKYIFTYLLIHSIKSETIPIQALTSITLKFSMKHDASLFKLIPLPTHLPFL